jgi:hypothetical protein
VSTLDIWRKELRAAWTSMWLVDRIDAHRLVAVPRLRLSQEVALELTSRLSYSTVFADATVCVLDDPPRPFVVVHATFDLYRTGEPDISGFAVLVPSPGAPLPPQAVVIARTAEMLRGAL